MTSLYVIEYKGKVLRSEEGWRRLPRTYSSVYMAKKEIKELHRPNPEWPISDYKVKKLAEDYV